MSPKETLRVIIAEDDNLLRQGLASLLAEAGFEIRAEVADADSLVRRVKADPPDVAMVDIRMPPTYTTEGLLKQRITDRTQLVDALHRVTAGEPVLDPLIVTRLFGRRRRPNPLDELTEREREVLAEMAEGRSNQAISDLLHVSPKTVETHIRSIFLKLNIQPEADDHRRVLAVLTYLRQTGQ